jgi:hypothetical protein
VPGEFFQVRSIAGHPIAGVRTLPISVSVRKVRPVWDFHREFLRIFAAESPAPGDFFSTFDRLRVTRLRVFVLCRFPSVFERFARCGTFAVNFFGFSRLKVLHRAIFFKVRSIEGHPIVGG